MAKERVTYFVVAAFKAVPGRQSLQALDPFEAPNAEAAKRSAKLYSEGGGAAIAFSRTGDPMLGQWDDAVILAQVGVIPDQAMTWLMEAA